MSLSICFFFNDTATTEIYTLSLHDALPISDVGGVREALGDCGLLVPARTPQAMAEAICFLLSSPKQIDRKSTRLNSSHLGISYAVFCLKKKKKKQKRESIKTKKEHDT